MNYLSFGQAFKFYSFQAKSMQNKIAKIFSSLYAGTHKTERRINPEALRLSYDHIKDFRNIRAHDERFYCSCVAKSKDISIRVLCADLETVLAAKNHIELMASMHDLVVAAESKLSVPIDLPVRMGWASRDTFNRDALSPTK